MDAERKTLWHKLAEVQGELEALEKDQTANMGTYSYDYVSEASLMEAVRSKLAERGVAVSVSWTSVEFQGNLAILKGALFFTNGDNPEEREAVQLLGTGTDKGDKAIYKAMTGAVRYGLWKTFLIPAGIDNEQEKVERTAEPPAQNKAKAAKNSQLGRIESIEKRLGQIAEAFDCSLEDAEHRFQAIVDKRSEEQGWKKKPWREVSAGGLGAWIGTLDKILEARHAEIQAEKEAQEAQEALSGAMDDRAADLAGSGSGTQETAAEAAADDEKGEG